MENTLFSTPHCIENWVGSLRRKQSLEMEDFEEFWSALNLYQEIPANGQENQLNSSELHYQSNVFRSMEPVFDLADQKSYVPQLCPPADARGPHMRTCLKRLNRANMSMADVFRVAGERYMQFSTQRVDGLSMFIHPYGSAFSELSLQETREVELMHALLVAADKIACRLYDAANEYLSRCRSMASFSGNSVERLVFYFAEALQDRVDGLTGRMTAARTKERIQIAKTLGLGDHPEYVAWNQGLPFSQVTQIIGIQAIEENVKNASKIHLIDLEIRSGVQWIALLQALAERKGRAIIKDLKITAVGTTDREKIEATGKRLLSFAKSLNLPLEFHVVSVSDSREIREELLGVKPGETVAVYCHSILRSMISAPDSLDNLMKVIRSLGPSIMVVIETEANHNSPSFLNRFIEALFFYGAFFDCLEECMERDNKHRLSLEAFHFGEGILNIVATEGEERVTRNVSLQVWRAFFERFGMEETELSESSVYQGSLVLKQSLHGASCNLDRNGKGLIVGWKGTPIHSLTTWKFL